VRDTQRLEKRLGASLARSGRLHPGGTGQEGRDGAELGRWGGEACGSGRVGQAGLKLGGIAAERCGAARGRVGKPCQWVRRGNA
jgi:hypothetical protein